MKPKGEILTDIVKVATNIIESKPVSNINTAHKDILSYCFKIRNDKTRKNILSHIVMLDMLTSIFTKQQEYYNSHIASLNILTNDYFEQIKNK